MVAASGIGFSAPASAQVSLGYWDGYAFRPNLPGAQGYGVNPYVPNSSYYNNNFNGYYGNYYGNYYGHHRNRWLNRRSNWWY